MGKTTAIEWTATKQPDGTMVSGATFNPWIGCEKVSPACTHCYAENSTPVRVAGSKFGLKLWGAESTGAVRRAASEAMWREPVKWNEQAKKDGVRKKVFCSSLADVFEDYDGQIVTHEGKQLWLMLDGKFTDNPPSAAKFVSMADLRKRLFELIDRTPHLDWLLLTKRPENIKKLWPFGWYSEEFRWSNVWMGTTVENQKYLDERLPHLLSVPAVVRWLSIEPLLGPMRMPTGKIWCRYHNRYEESLALNEDSPCFRWQSNACDLIDWLVVGGETQDGARPTNPDWISALLVDSKQCALPFFFKQWGDWLAFTIKYPGATWCSETVALNTIKADGIVYTDNDIEVDEDNQYIYARMGKAKTGKQFMGKVYLEYPKPVERDEITIESSDCGE